VASRVSSRRSDDDRGMMPRTLRDTVILIFVCLVSAETAVRMAGISPIPRPSPVRGEARITMEDPQLGWTNRPSSKRAFRIPGEPPHTVTILESGARATSPRAIAHDNRRDVIFIGCSFTHGWGLNDEETFAWRVQAALPDWNVYNFGVNAYGTCQAYMLLKRLYERQKWHKPVVIYGFIDEHEARNVADHLWHYMLSILTSTGNVSLPSCMMDSSGSIVFNPPRPYPQFPFRHTLAAIPILEKIYLKVQGVSLANQSQEITKHLLAEMETFTTARSGTFGVLFFKSSQPRSSYYRQFLENRRSRIIDINLSGQKNTERLTFFDGHPNSRMADVIAQSIIKFIWSLGD